MTVNGLSSITRTVENLKDNLEDEVNDAVDDTLDATERRAKFRIVSQDAVATTDLYRGFRQVRHPIQHPRGNGTRFRLMNTEPHAKFVEWGTGGHFMEGASWGYTPPEKPYKAPSYSNRLVRNIVEWIVVKPGFRRSGPPIRMARNIAQSIAFGSEADPLPGTPAQPFMRPAWFVESKKLKWRLVSAVHTAARTA